jgi:hypothetical protein
VPPSGTDAGEGLTEIETSVAVVPLPLRETFWGLLLAPSVKLRVPDRLPVVVVLKVTDAVQLAPAANVLGLIGQLELREKSTRLLAIFVIASDVDWLLVRVTVCEAPVVPTVWVPNVSVAGLATAASTPFPVRLTVGSTVALSEMVSTAFLAPTTEGVKNTDTLQLAPAANAFGLIGQVDVVV